MQLKSTFQLQVHSELSALDYKVLALLYQPLLGVTAHSLIVTLYQLNHKVSQRTFTHQYLLDILNLKQQAFLKARHQLEALNLMNVFQEQSHYVYCLKMPLSPKQFLVDTIFGSYLKTEIGEDNLEDIKALFKLDTVDLSNYENITKSFDELYEFKATNLLEIDHELQGKIQNGGSLIKYQFDYNAFVELLPERVKNTQLLTDKFKDQVTKIAFVYQYTPNEMATIFEKTYQPNEQVTFNQLTMKATQYYQKNKQKLTIKEKDLTQAEILSRVTPELIIQKYGKANYIAMALETASHMMERNQIDIGIINVLIMFVIKHKDGILPTLKYMEIVLADWMKKGVLTTEDALAYASKLEDEHTKYKQQYKKAPRQAQEPDWLDAYLKDIEKMEG